MLDLNSLVAIDIHTHADGPCGTEAYEDAAPTREAMKAYFKHDRRRRPSMPEIAALLPRAQDRLRDLHGRQRSARPGTERYSNEEVARLAHENDDIMIPFASIDPHKGKLGAREARRLVKDFGVKGFKFHPSTQGFFPNDRMAYPLYEAIAEAEAPALFHTGQTGVGSGMRGGGGMRLKYSNPMYLDDVAVDFPDMPIIMAHPVLPLAGGGARRSRSTSRTSTSTCRAGRRNIFRRFWCITPTRC